LWQALRRVWRLGQTKPVKALFSVYEGSMEARALALMGAKMKAGQLLYGDEVGGAIVPEDDGDFLTQLARDVLKGAQLDDLQSLFADDHFIHRSSQENLVVVQMPKMVEVTSKTWVEWAQEKGKITIRGRIKKSEISTPLQPGLW